MRRLPVILGSLRIFLGRRYRILGSLPVIYVFYRIMTFSPPTT